MAIVAIIEEAQKMSEFGRTLYSLMLERGIERRQQLLGLLRQAGYPISQTRLSYYMNGHRNVDPLFVECVSELLGLTKRERERLAWAYAFGQGKPSERREEILRRARELGRG